jgi:hypothetical protein
LRRLPGSHAFTERYREKRERAEWLVQFAQTDLSQLSERSRKKIQKEFLAHFRSARPSDLFPVHDWLKQGLAKLIVGEGWQITEKIHYCLSLGKGTVGTLSELSRGEGAPTGEFLCLEVIPLSRLQLIGVFHDFESAGLVKCSECGTLFVPRRRDNLFARRKRDYYCSARCSQTARTRRWRKQHPDQAREIRHVQHLKAIGLRGKRLEQAIKRWRENEEAKRSTLQG